jgi:hypothetical protein
VRCEEKFPQTGAHSVLLVVVERDPQIWQTKAEPLHRELFGLGKTDPLAPTQLEIIDRATDETLKKLIAAGLIADTTRATRPLFSTESGATTPAPLSAEELAKLRAHVEKATHALRIGQVLGNAGFESEARGHVLEAILKFAQAFAVRNQFPEPASVQDALTAPLSTSWGEALTVIREYIATTALPIKPVLEALAGMNVEACQ